ncbi:MAG: Xaa-Pro peptidase family protein [Candidatus Bathyarchaeia archaeon]
MPSTDRIKKLRNILAQKNIDALLVADEKNIYYLTGFIGGFRLLMPIDGESILFVHSVNYEAAKENAKNARIEVIRIGEKSDTKIFDEIIRCKFRSLGFDRINAVEYLRIMNNLGNLKLEPLDDALWTLRKIKDEGEIVLIKKAAELTSRGMKKAIEILRPGLKEREVAAEIEYEMRKSGSTGIAFDTIICSGPESAFPHGGLGEREIKRGDFVVIDIGAKYFGYCADMTRTLIIGEPSEKQKRIYKTVKEAQNLAINRIRAGVKARDVDEVARRYIIEMNYGEYFVHSLGHGVGLDIHEPPTLGPSSEEILSAGNIVTVEPGIYIPRFGGVRFEDTVLVLEDKAERLTYINEDERREI